MKTAGPRMYHVLEVHFLHFHFHYFPENLGALSDEKGERFHQDVKEIERRYQGRSDVPMVADCCWCLTRDDLNRITSTKQLSVHLQQSRGVNNKSCYVFDRCNNMPQAYAVYIIFFTCIIEIFSRFCNCFINFMVRLVT